MEQKNKSACSDVNSFNIHASGEDYLETILVLQKKRGMVRSVDVLWSSFFVTLVAKKYRLATMLPFVPRMVCDSR